jgi:pyoverdine/dityrosine biosynthesis protein Dit1
MDILKEVSEIIKDYSYHMGELTLINVPLLKRIALKIETAQELVFLLPAFPAKSPSPSKTSGEMPDLGEVLALQGLQNLCQRISSIYTPGAKVIICSDGRVFSDVVRVSDESITRYQEGIIEIIKEFKLDRLETFALDDLFPDQEGEELRFRLLNQFAKSLEDVKAEVRTNEDFKNLFNGLHRFLLEDELVLNRASSKNKISKETKERTYELLRRSDAWSTLLNHHFKDQLRLSIHPYHLEHEKFGIKLVSSSSKWATPWHNVTVKIKDKFELMHLKDALKLNALPKLMKDKYAYFEVAEV